MQFNAQMPTPIDRLAFFFILQGTIEPCFNFDPEAAAEELRNAMTGFGNVNMHDLLRNLEFISITAKNVLELSG